MSNQRLSRSRPSVLAFLAAAAVALFPTLTSASDQDNPSPEPTSGTPTTQSAPAPQPTCADADKSHQFDFWIGEWDVFAQDKKAGENTIRPILDGCVLQETWNGAGGSAGSSFNFYNPRTGKWHQFWVWRNGTTLDLSGGMVDGEMVLTGNSLSREGDEVLNRITWTPNTDGTVRQHWQVSADGGQTWTTSFDGLYRKK